MIEQFEDAMMKRSQTNALFVATEVAYDQASDNPGNVDNDNDENDDGDDDDHHYH